MNIGYFDKYINHEYNGVKIRPKLFLNKFVQSFENYKEKELWTIEYLPVFENYFNDYIPYELFEVVIFPVLFNGYKNNNELKKCLIKFGKNCVRNKNIWWKLGYEFRYEIIEKLFDLEPDNEEIIDTYLHLKIKDIEFRLHHPPHIIIYEKEIYTELLEEVSIINKLDRNKIYSEYINAYMNKLKKYFEKNNDMHPNFT
jgi:hypothetical protein